jgi:hypothetical protein
MCCGKKRQQIRQATSAHSVPERSVRKFKQPKLKSNSQVYFKYLGESKLKVVGPKTRKLYRFNRHGAVVAVDPRDQRALTDVHTLREVKLAR